MTEALIGFLIGIAGTYLAMTHENGYTDDFQAMLRELEQEEAEAAGG